MLQEVSELSEALKHTTQTRLTVKHVHTEAGTKQPSAASNDASNEDPEIRKAREQGRDSTASHASGMISAAQNTAHDMREGAVGKTVKEAAGKASEEDGVIGKTTATASHMTGKAQEGIGEIAGNQDEVARGD